MTLTGWSRSIREHMSEMTVATGAGDLRPDHAMGDVLFGGDRLGRDAIPEAGPARARIELGG
mgnify:CR=1 FL=1